MVVLVIENGEFNESMHGQGRNMNLDDTKTSKFIDTIQLRRSFYSLFNQEFSDFDLEEMSLTFGGSWTKARKIFRNSIKENPDTLLLIDSDCADDKKTDRIKELKLKPKEAIFFMVQEMEAWFLSQPEVLENYYGKKESQIKSKILKHPQEYEKPAKELNKILAEHYPEKVRMGKGLYQKMGDDAPLIERLNLAKLKEDFEDVKRLVEVMQTKIAEN